MVTEVVCCIVVRIPRVGNFAPCGKNAKLLIVSPHVPTKKIQGIRQNGPEKFLHNIFIIY